jgi:hypothetical protein
MSSQATVDKGCGHSRNPQPAFLHCGGVQLLPCMCWRTLLANRHAVQCAMRQPARKICSTCDGSQGIGVACMWTRLHARHGWSLVITSAHVSVWVGCTHAWHASSVACLCDIPPRLHGGDYGLNHDTIGTGVPSARVARPCVPLHTFRISADGTMDVDCQPHGLRVSHTGHLSAPISKQCEGWLPYNTEGDRSSPGPEPRYPPNEHAARGLWHGTLCSIGAHRGTEPGRP